MYIVIMYSLHMFVMFMLYTFCLILSHGVLLLLYIPFSIPFLLLYLYSLGWFVLRISWIRLSPYLVYAFYILFLLHLSYTCSYHNTHTYTHSHTHAFIHIHTLSPNHTLAYSLNHTFICPPSHLHTHFHHTHTFIHTHVHSFPLGGDS